MACAFGMKDCKQYYTVKYIRLSDLFFKLKAARTEGNFQKVLSEYTKSLLLIVDEWLLLKLTEFKSRNFLELIHKCGKKPQPFFVSGLGKKVGMSGLGEMIIFAIMDLIVYDLYKVNIGSIDLSRNPLMRKIYGLDKSQSKNN